MLALLHLAGAALLGACLARRVLRGALEAWEQALWGTVAGWMLAGLSAYALARWQGRLSYATVAWATLFVWASAALLLAPAAARLRGRNFAPSGWLSLSELRGRLGRRHAGLACVLAACAPVYWRLFSSHTFAEGPGGVYSGGSAWYDLSFHAALAASFAHGENFPPAYTPMAGEPLLYPFMPDFHAAALVAAGLSLRAAFLATALPLALATTGLFYSLALRVARSAAAAALATALFLLNGGLGFVLLFEDWRRSGRGFAEFWGALPFNYANDWARGIHWTNLVADTFLPQRASLYGLPAGLMVITLFALAWRRWHDGSVPPAVAGGRDIDGLIDESSAVVHQQDFIGKPSPVNPPATEGGADLASVAVREARRPSDGRLLFVAGLLAGLLPLFHTHSYIAVGLLSVFLFLQRPRRAWLAFWLPALLLAAPHLWALAWRAGEASVVRLQPGWMGADAPSFAAYMLRNFGPPLLLAFPAWLAAPRAWKTFYAAFALLLAFALVVVVSPNVFDNGKLTYYWHAFNSVLVARWLVSLARARRLRALTAPLAALLALLSVAAGVAALRAEGRASALLFSEADLAAARFARERTPPRALFLTAPAFNQPVLCLAGRPVLRGPTAWLWGHGHEFRAREADVRRIYAGASDALELLKLYGVDFVYLGGAERDGLKANAAFFDSNFPAVYRGAGVQIYDARAGLSGARQHGDPAPRDLAARVGRDPFALLEEFSHATFFAHMILKERYGREPRREEFMDAMKVMGRDLRAGAPGWREYKLVENQMALAEQLAGGDRARQSALLSAVLVQKLDAREYDAAYVRAHFFGYLGRDPDPEGFDFWLGVLTRNGDRRALSRAFIESDEYKNRPLEP